MTDAVKKIINDVLDENCQKTDAGWSVELYCDYRDLEIDAGAIKHLASQDDMRQSFYELLDEGFRESIWQEEDQLTSLCRTALDHAGVEYNPDEVDDYVRGNVVIAIPVDDILSRNTVCVNILVDNGDANYDFTHNSFAHGYYGDGEVEDSSALVWLAQQQGCYKDDIQRALEAGTAFTGECLKVIEAYNDALSVLKDYGYRIEFGRDRSFGQYAAARRILDQQGECQRAIRKAQTRINETPDTYDKYLAECERRGITPVSPEKYESIYQEIVSRANDTIAKQQETLDTLSEELTSKGLDGVVAAMNLFKTIGARRTELAQTDEYKKAKFIDSIIDASASTTSGLNALTFCVQISLGEYMDLRDAVSVEKELNSSSLPPERKGTGSIVLNSCTHTILYDAWNGAGSLEDIQLKNDVLLPINLIHSAEPDGLYGYGIMGIYGTNEEFYTPSLESIFPMSLEEVRALAGPSSLADRITAAEAVKTTEPRHNDVPSGHDAPTLE